MEFICTICCKEKREDSISLPAIERYLSRRIEFVVAESRRHNKPMLILSGKYGLLLPDALIPWYDQALNQAAVSTLAARVAGQLRQHNVERLIFYGLARTLPEWEPYHEVLAIACRASEVELVVEVMQAEWVL